MSSLLAMIRRTVAVLRLADQERGAIPHRCVKTGVRTDGAVRAIAVDLRRADLWQLALGPAVRLVALALRRPWHGVVLPVTPEAWSRVMRTTRIAVALAGLGLGSTVAGLVGADAVLLGLGGVLLVLAWVVRLVGQLRRWVGLDLVSGGDTVRVHRVSPEFTESARQLFVRSLLR